MSASLTRKDRSTEVRIEWPKLTEPLIVLAQVARPEAAEASDKTELFGGVLAVACGTEGGSVAFAIDEAACQEAFGDNYFVAVELAPWFLIRIDPSVHDDKLLAKFGQMPQVLDAKTVPASLVLVVNDRKAPSRWLVSEVPWWIDSSLGIKPRAFRRSDHVGRDTLGFRHVGWQVAGRPGPWAGIDR